LCGFLSATFWAGVNAAHCPITCPKRRIPGTLYAMPFVGKKTVDQIFKKRYIKFNTYEKEFL